jgi:hypothetical protein
MCRGRHGDDPVQLSSSHRSQTTSTHRAAPNSASAGMTMSRFNRRGGGHVLLARRQPGTAPRRGALIPGTCTARGVVLSFIFQSVSQSVSSRPPRAHHTFQCCCCCCSTQRANSHSELFRRGPPRSSVNFPFPKRTASHVISRSHPARSITTRPTVSQYGSAAPAVKHKY